MKVLFLMLVLSANTWVEDFLRRYNPAETAAATASNTPSPLAQLLQTGTVPITMNDVVNMMIEKNLDIRSNRLSPRSSYFQSLIFHRALEPSIRFGANIVRNTNQSNNQLNGVGQLFTSQLRGNYSVGFTQMLEMGTTLSVDATMNRLSSSSNLSTFNPSYTGQIVYGISQPLLRDFGRTANMRQILISKNNEKVSEIQFETQITNLLVQAQKTYWDLVFAGEDQKVKQRSLDLANRTLEENKMKVEIGTLAPIDVVQTQSEVASRRDQLLVSTHNITSSEDQIKKLTSNDKDPSMFLIKFQPSEQPRRPESVQLPTLEEAITIAVENRPEMRQALLDIKNKDIDVEYTNNQKLPVFDINASYNQNGVGGRLIERAGIGGAAAREVPGGISDAFKRLFGYNYTGYQLGFSFVLPIGNKAAEADYSRALNERQLAQSKLDATAQAIALEVRNAITQVEMNRARIETAAITRQYAQQQLEAEQTKFSLGTSTLRFVLEEQRNVAQAETNELQTIVNFTKSLVDLDKAMGLTLRKNNVEIEKTLNPVAINIRRMEGSAAN